MAAPTGAIQFGAPEPAAEAPSTIKFGGHVEKEAKPMTISTGGMPHHTPN